MNNYNKNGGITQKIMKYLTEDRIRRIVEDSIKKSIKRKPILHSGALLYINGCYQ